MKLTEKFLRENIKLKNNAMPGMLKNCSLLFSEKLQNIISYQAIEKNDFLFEDKLNNRLVKMGLLNDNLCLTSEGYLFFE